MNPHRILAAILALCVAGLPASRAADRPHPGAPPAVPRGAIHISFDFAVPEGFLALVRGRVIDDDSLNAWVDLPGNSEILRIGALEGSLSREQLRENLWHAVLGHGERTGRGVGSLAVESLDSLESLVLRLKAMRARIERAVQSSVEPFLPATIDSVDAIVRFHLGGGWSGRSSDDIYVSMSFLGRFSEPRLLGIESLVAHEVVHLIHGKVSPLPADGMTAEALFGAALAQVHAEGIARHVEYELLQAGAPDGTFAEFARWQCDSGLAGFANAFRNVDRIREACMRQKDMDGCRSLIRRGISRGGSIYATGHGMARAIEQALGRSILAGTLQRGPGAFFELYLQAARMLPGLPVPGEGFSGDLTAADRALEDRRRLWDLERAASRLHAAGDYAGAAEILGRVLGLSPRNAAAAYNLACALARDGREREAVEWLRKSIEFGYSDFEHLAADPDLQPLRGREDYRSLFGSDGGPGESSAPNSSMYQATSAGSTLSGFSAPLSARIAASESAALNSLTVAVAAPR